MLSVIQVEATPDHNQERLRFSGRLLLPRAHRRAL